jgi:hypothetical protein
MNHRTSRHPLIGDILDGARALTVAVWELAIDPTAKAEHLPRIARALKRACNRLSFDFGRKDTLCSDRRGAAFRLPSTEPIVNQSPLSLKAVPSESLPVALQRVLRQIGVLYVALIESSLDPASLKHARSLRIAAADLNRTFNKLAYQLNPISFEDDTKRDHQG